MLSKTLFVGSFLAISVGATSALAESLVLTEELVRKHYYNQEDDRAEKLVGQTFLSLQDAKDKAFELRAEDKSIVGRGKVTINGDQVVVSVNVPEYFDGPVAAKTESLRFTLDKEAAKLTLTKEFGLAVSEKAGANGDDEAYARLSLSYEK